MKVKIYHAGCIIRYSTGPTKRIRNLDNDIDIFWICLYKLK